MIDELDRSLENLLRREPPELVSQITISFATPDGQFPPPSVTLPAVDLFLYDVRENRDLRDSEWRIERQSDGSAVRKAPMVRVDCSYLITAWPSEGSTTPARDEHRMLGEVMKALLRHSTLPAGVLEGSLQGQQPPLPASSLQPGRLQSLAEFWQALGGKPKATLSYTVTIGVDPGTGVETGPPVRETALKLRQVEVLIMAAENWQIVRHRAAIAGRVTAAGTGRPLSGARVEITAGPQSLTARLALLARQHGSRWAAMAERPDRTRTATDGFFRFLDLPAGQYTLSATLPGEGSRYGTASVQVTLTADGEGNVSLGTASLALPATTVKGRVSGPSDTAVQMAEVRVQGSGERTWSDAEGNYVLSGVETGSRKLTIAARGFQSKTETVALGQPGAVANRDVTLSTP